MGSVLIFSIISCLLILGGFIYIVILKSKEGEFPKDNIKVINFLSQYTNGYCEGFYLNKIFGDKRSIINFRPTDVDFNYAHKVGDQDVVVKNSLIETFPKGTLSNEVSIMYLLPPDAESLPKDFRETTLGKTFANIIAKQNARDVALEVLKSKSNVEDDLLMRTEGKQRVKEFLEQNLELNKEIVKIKESNERRGGGNSYMPPKQM